METLIGAFDTVARTVPVTFTEGDIVHTRDVNACINDAGNYDEAATQERVAQVAQGVAHKLAVGAIRQVELAPSAESDVAADAIRQALEAPAA